SGRVGEPAALAERDLGRPADAGSGTRGANRGRAPAPGVRRRPRLPVPLGHRRRLSRAARLRGAGGARRGRCPAGGGGRLGGGGPGTVGRVVVDPALALTQAEGHAGSLVAQFRLSFVGGLAAALLAAFWIIRLIRRAELLAAERSRFAVAAAHELRTPLAGI